MEVGSRILAAYTGGKTFQILASENNVFENTAISNVISRQIKHKTYSVATWGNLDSFPQEVRIAVGSHGFLPTLINKTVALICGKGIKFFKKVAKNNISQNVSVVNNKFEKWLQTWEQHGLDPIETYLYKIFLDWYTFGNSISQYFRLSNNTIGLKHIHCEKVRFADENLNLLNLSSIGLDSSMFSKMLIDNGNIDFSPIFPKFNWNSFLNIEKNIRIKYFENNPIQHSSCPSPSNLYGYPDYFIGSRKWIQISNLTPEYISSFFNGVNIPLEITIPESWVESKKKELRDVCEKYKELTTDAKSEVSNFYATNYNIDITNGYNSFFIQKFIDKKMNELAETCSSESGKNQGKFFVNLEKWDVESEQFVGWKIKQIPLNYVEQYIKPRLEVDARAKATIVGNYGFPQSLTNFPEQSSTKTDILYQYNTFLRQNEIHVKMCLAALNNAFRISFPNESEIFVGLEHPTLEALENVTTDKRLLNIPN